MDAVDWSSPISTDSSKKPSATGSNDTASNRNGQDDPQGGEPNRMNHQALTLADYFRRHERMCTSYS
jgi:hypothetical protein